MALPLLNVDVFQELSPIYLNRRKYCTLNLEIYQLCMSQFNNPQIRIEKKLGVRKCNSSKHVFHNTLNNLWLGSFIDSRIKIY